MNITASTQYASDGRPIHGKRPTPEKTASRLATDRFPGLPGAQTGTPYPALRLIEGYPGSPYAYWVECTAVPVICAEPNGTRTEILYFPRRDGKTAFHIAREGVDTWIPDPGTRREAV